MILPLTLAIVPLPEEALPRAGGRKGRRTLYIINLLSPECKGKPPQKRPRIPCKEDMTGIPGNHKENGGAECEKNRAEKLDNFRWACYNKLLSEQTRRTACATPRGLCTLGLITLRPLSPKGGATKWQSTKPC